MNSNGILTDLGSPVLGDHNTGILVLCTILVYKFVPVLYQYCDLKKYIVYLCI